MINPSHEPGCCQVCSEPLPPRNRQFCSLKCKAIGTTGLTRKQMQRLRALCAENVKTTGRPMYKVVARELKIEWLTVRHHWKVARRRKQRAIERASVTGAHQIVILAKTNLAREIAEAREARAVTAPFKSGNLKW